MEKNWSNYGKWRHLHQLQHQQLKSMSREIKKCVLEILDALYDRAGFDDWWDRLDEKLEDEITQELEEIIKRRLRDR